MLSRYTAGTTITRNDHGIERPRVNTRIEGKEVDFVWRDARLIVEVDGYRYHRSPSTD